MNNKLHIYIVGNYKPGDADGLAEFNSQNVLLLKDTFCFHFVQFDKLQPTNFYKHELKDSFDIHIFGTRNLSEIRLSSPFCNWINNLSNKNTIFHLSHIYNLTNYFIARKLLKSNIPYLITPHDSFVYSPSFTIEKPFLKRFYRNLFVHIFDKYVLDHASVIHGLTPQCSSSLKFLTKSPVTIVNNQVNDMNLKFDPLKIKQQVCFIGRFDIYRKGIDLSLKAFQLFKKEKKNSEDVNFTLVGPADSAAVIKRIELCEELRLKVGEDVIFTGKIPVAERNRILMQSKAYIHLARTEGFGLSIARALSCPKPVIVSKQIPICDKIAAHNAGFVVNNPEEAAQALANIFALSPSEYIKMSMNARRCYEQEFHPNVIKPQLIDLYLKTFHIKNYPAMA